VNPQGQSETSARRQLVVVGRRRRGGGGDVVGFGGRRKRSRRNGHGDRRKRRSGQHLPDGPVREFRVARLPRPAARLPLPDRPGADGRRRRLQTLARTGPPPLARQSLVSFSSLLLPNLCTRKATWIHVQALALSTTIYFLYFYLLLHSTSILYYYTLPLHSTTSIYYYTLLFLSTTI